MWYRLFLSLILFYCATNLYAQPVQTNICNNSQLQVVINNNITPLIKNRIVPAVEIGIYTQGTVCYFSFGQTIIGGQLRSPDQHTLFEIGSNTKTFTATLLAIAVERHLLKLNDVIDNPIYLPTWLKINPDANLVTFAELANFSSGMPRMPSVFSWYSLLGADPIEKLGFDNYSQNDFAKFIANWAPDQVLPSSWQYSNTSYAVLGYLLTNIFNHNSDYGQLVKQIITSPLAMNDTVLTVSTEQQTRLAQGYQKWLLFSVRAPYWPLSVFDAAGILKSTAEDLMVFIQANLGIKKIGEVTVSPELLSAMQLTHQVNYYFHTPFAHVHGQALAWMTNPANPNHNQDEIIYKNGATAGFTSFIGFDPTKKIGVVILTNGSALRSFQISLLITSTGVKIIQQLVK